MKFVMKFLASILFFYSFFSSSFANELVDTSCFAGSNANYHRLVLDMAARNDFDTISSLPNCVLLNKPLAIRASIANPSFFKFAPSSLKKDKLFIKRLIKLSPNSFQFVDEELRSDPAFVESIFYDNPEALKYASPSLLDNKSFIKRMINLDAKNYLFASDRLKSDLEIAKIAIAKDGMMLQFAPEAIKSNANAVAIAVNSSRSAIIFANDSLKSDVLFKKLSGNLKSKDELDSLVGFLKEKYVVDNQIVDGVFTFDGRGKFSAKSILIDQNYVAKWIEFESDNFTESARLIPVEDRNPQNYWLQDFKQYPDLTKKIASILLQNKVPSNVIKALKTNFLIKTNEKSEKIILGIYSLSGSADKIGDNSILSVTSLVAIAKKVAGKWQITIIELLPNKQFFPDIAYKWGHKKYEFWDLYPNSKSGFGVIFKVEDRFGQHLELFEADSTQKFSMTYCFLNS